MTIRERSATTKNRPATPSNKDSVARRLTRRLYTVIIVAVFLGLWQLLPKVGWLAHRYRFLDSFFISSPPKVVQSIWDLLTGTGGRPSIWPYLGATLKAVVLGVVIGTLLGMLVGLLLAASPRAMHATEPILNFLNATPRIAIIPIFVIVFGPTTATSVISDVAIVFFISFYNAYNGALTPSSAMLQNAQLLGANRWHLIWQIRVPYTMVWTTASLPNSISFGVIAVVTTEILTGTHGIGQLINDSLSNVDSALTLSLVVILGIVGVALLGLTRLATKKPLAWWEAQTKR